VIVEESGIAKGIRRIVGLTRQAAKTARMQAADILSRLDGVQRLAGGPELSAAYKNLKSEVDKSVVSLVDKEQMRTKLAAIYETIKAHFKANLAQRIADASGKAEQVAAAAKANNQDVVVLGLEIGADGKVAKKILEQLRSIHADGSFFLASLDDEGEKVGVYPMVSTQHAARGMSAKVWVDHVVGKAGRGKGGGKVDTANGSLPVAAESSNINSDQFLAEVLGWAEEYPTSTLSK